MDALTKGRATRGSQPLPRWTGLRIAALGIIAALATSSSALAADVVWIEEHWQLTIGEPDAESSAPQISMMMSPYGDLDHDFFLFSLNHQSHPDFRSGGLQVQHWNSDGEVSHSSDKEGCLHHANETISWVQRLSIHEGDVTYEILDGHSQSWGQFGDTGQLRKTFESSLHNLNDYDPGLSITESGVNYAGNRVSSLVLTRLRWGTAQGNVHELQAPIDVDTDLDP